MSDAPESIVAIDIGTNKISVLIGRVLAADRIEVVGMAYAPNKGMSKGVVKNLEKVISAIKTAVAAAEDMADCRVHTAWVAIPSPELLSNNASGRTPVMNGTIGTTEIVRTLEMAKSAHLRPEHYLINAVPLGVEIDQQADWVDYPINMSAGQIVGHYHLMMVPIMAMQNLDKALKGAGIGVERMVVSSLATAEAALLKNEREFGVCLIDIGAGTTNIAVYLEDRLILSHTIQRGGESVTRDIASILQTSMEQAESLKLRHGCVDRTSVKADQMIQIPGIGTAPGMMVSRMELADIIIARYEEILEQVRQLLADSGALNVLQHGIVLSGEAAQIEGIVAMARRIFGVQVHLGNHPTGVDCAKERRAQLRRPMYATASGLLLYSQSELQRFNDSATAEEGGKEVLDVVLSPWRWLINKLKNLV